MAKKYTRNELWQFVWRADTPEKIELASEWLAKNWRRIGYGKEDYEFFDDLQVTLGRQCDEYYHTH